MIWLKIAFLAGGAILMVIGIIKYRLDAGGMHEHLNPFEQPDGLGYILGGFGLIAVGSIMLLLRG